MNKSSLIIISLAAALYMGGCQGKNNIETKNAAPSESEMPGLQGSIQESESVDAQAGVQEAYAEIMAQNDLLDQYGLCPYGRISTALIEQAEVMDQGNCYEVTEQKLYTPVYYSWSEIESLKVGDQAQYSDGDSVMSYEITDILQEEDKRFRLIQTKSQSEDEYAPVFCYEDIFQNGMYAMAELMDGVPERYTGYKNYERPNGLVDCSKKVVYQGSFFLAKDCHIKVDDRELTVEEILDENSGWGFIDGWIDALDEKGWITRIVQQTAG